MKYLALVLSLFCGLTFADVVVSPGCPPQVSVGGGLPSGCNVAPADPRRASIKAYWDAYAIYPGMVFDAMLQFGVDADELESVLQYRVDITHWLRYNKAPDTLIKTWDDTLIDQVLTWAGRDIADKWERVNVQDDIDLAYARKEAYKFHGIPVPDSIAPWEHPRPLPAPNQPQQPCVNNVCVTVGP